VRATAETPTGKKHRHGQIEPAEQSPVTPLECPVWNATWVTTTPTAAHARIPSTAGKKLRIPPTGRPSVTITVCLWSR